MDPTKLRLLIGSSLEQNRLQEPDLDVVKAKYDAMVRGAAANEAVEELEGVEIALLAKADRK
jgi:hypothetical protein